MDLDIIIDTIIAVRNPPILPSHDFFGEILSKSLFFPIALPIMYAPLSLAHKIRKNANKKTWLNVLSVNLFIPIKLNVTKGNTTYINQNIVIAELLRLFFFCKYSSIISINNKTGIMKMYIIELIIPTETRNIAEKILKPIIIPKNKVILFSLSLVKI